MKIYRSVITPLLVISLLFICTDWGFSQEIVRVESESAEIHVDPESTDSQFILAEEGDLFELASYNNGWVGIYMFSGNIRYIKMNDIDIEYDPFREEYGSPANSGLCREVHMIEDEAAQEAGSTYPADQDKADVKKDLIIDRGVLNLFRSKNIPATHNSIFLDCVNDSLVPFSQ